MVWFSRLRLIWWSAAEGSCSLGELGGQPVSLLISSRSNWPASPRSEVPEVHMAQEELSVHMPIPLSLAGQGAKASDSSHDEQPDSKLSPPGW